MKKKIKVLQVIPKLGYGGAETGCYDLAHYLAEQSYKSFIATSGGELLNFIDKKKVRVFKLPVHSKNPFLILFNAILLSLIILIYNIDIVHARSRAPAWSCLLATKITFMNEIANFCEKVGADVDMVRMGIGSDPRIGNRFLFPGIGYGGSCFPKDVQALAKSGDEYGYHFGILESVMSINEKQKTAGAGFTYDNFKLSGMAG